jgi:crotonyl-CoA carboxylase/reductase
MPAVAKVRTVAPLKDLYAIGEIPPLGHVPGKMHAWVIRKERHGPPDQSFQLEVVPTWPIADDEVLVYVMAAGVNYNGVWAGLGVPVSPLDGHKHPFHIAGSDASGVVWAVGAKVKRWKVGDEVIVHCNQDDGDDEDCNGGDPLLSPSQRIWGYETPDGSFAQFCRVQSRQLMLHTHAGDGLPHAVWPCAAHAQARRQCAGVGRLRRPWRIRCSARCGIRCECNCGCFG